MVAAQDDANAATAPALQVADLFNAQAAEAPYQLLVVVLNTQAARLQELHAKLRDLEEAQRAQQHDSRTLEAIVSPVDGRLQALEAQAVEHRQWKVSCAQRLAQMQRELQAKAERSELKAGFRTAEQRTTKLGHELRAEAASFQLVNSLQADQSVLHDRLETLDRRLSSKMEKSESSRLDGLLAQIQAFAPTASRISNQFEALETRQHALQRLLEEQDEWCVAHDDELARVSRSTEELWNELQRFEEHHRDVVPRVRELQEEDTRLHRALEELELAAATRDTTLRTLSAKFHSSAGAFAKQMERQRQNLQSLLDEKAPRVQVESQLTQLTDEMATKARETEHQLVARRLTDLEGQYEKLQHHVELSTRFLDWFARRGEAYEHNLELVETQLGRLAVASQPQTREPFGGHVRFPREP